jgi:galactokinase
MNNKKIIEAIDKKFNQLFKQKPLLVRSPGRVNIIGEHTDYNEGFVLPAAIDKAIYIAIAKREDNIIHIYSNEFAEEHQSD